MLSTHEKEGFTHPTKAPIAEKDDKEPASLRLSARATCGRLYIAPVCRLVIYPRHRLRFASHAYSDEVLYYGSVKPLQAFS